MGTKAGYLAHSLGLDGDSNSDNGKPQFQPGEDGTNPKDLVGVKKAALATVPPSLLVAASDALALGARKYGAFNWRDYPVQMMTYIEAAMRHLIAFQDGEDFDPESGKCHLHHVVACMAIVIDCIEAGTIIDNRPPPGPSAKMLAERDNSAKA